MLGPLPVVPLDLGAHVWLGDRALVFVVFQSLDRLIRLGEALEVIVPNQGRDVLRVFGPEKLRPIMCRASKYMTLVCQSASGDPVGATASRSSTITRAWPKSIRVGASRVGKRWTNALI